MWLAILTFSFPQSLPVFDAQQKHTGDIIMVPRDLNLAACDADNYILLPQKAVDEIKALLSATVMTVQSLDDEISRTLAILSDLQARRLQEISQVNTYQVAIAPHRKLPNEILSLIFCYASLFNLFVYGGHTDTQLVIGKVCKKWREISHGIPALWNNILWSVGDSPTNHSRGLKTVEGSLPRSAGSPLILNIQHHPMNPLILDIWTRLQAAIASRILSSRAGELKSLTMDHCTAPGLSSFLTLPHGSVGMLEHIDLTIEQSPEWEHLQISVFQHAQKLRKAILTLPCDFNPHSLNLPWEHLTDLSFPTATGSANNPPVDAILIQCSLLVNLTLDIMESETPGSVQTHSPIRLNNLRSFILNLHSHQSNLLKRLVMPNLVDITLYKCSKIAWQPEYTTHVTHSGLMHTISIDIPIPTNDIDTILTQNPHLIKLCLPTSGLFSQQSLDEMAVGKLVPKLEIMECQFSEDGLGIYLDMIQSRRAMGIDICSDIPTLEFNIHSQSDQIDYSISDVLQSTRSTIDRATTARVRKLRDDGWTIRVR